MLGVWEIIDAIGSMLGALLAGIAGLVAFRLYKIESERDRVAAEVAIRQQAASVAFWWDSPTSQLRVSNHSLLPIYFPSVHTTPPQTIGLCPTATTEQPKTAAMVLLPAEHAYAVVRKSPGVWMIYELEEHPSSEQMIILTFADNANIMWKRDLLGDLEPDNHDDYEERERAKEAA
jgi:hypothetical protein